MKLVIHAWRDLAHPQAGGSERLVDQLATGLAGRGHDVQLFCGGPVGTAAAGAGDSDQRGRSYAARDAGGTYSQYLRMPLLDRRHARGADLVLDVANGATYCTPLWRRGPTVLLVHHVHTEQWPLTFPRPIAAAGSWFERRLVPFVYRNCLVVAVSPSTAQALGQLGFRESQIRIVPNTIDAPPPGAAAARSTEPLFVALGRLVPHKRIELLLDAWEHVRPVVGGRLVVIGDGPERARLAARAGEGVELVGRVDDDHKHRLLAEAWLLVHAASHEGWGIAITEAGAHGTPALAFDAPGVRDAIVDAVTGRLVTSPDELAKVWVELAGDRAQLGAYGEAARLRATELDVNHTVDLFEEVALEAIARGPRGRSQ